MDLKRYTDRIPKWLPFVLGGLAVLIIVFKRRQLIIDLPNNLRRVVIPVVDDATGQALSRWNAWRELCRPFANMVADALDRLHWHDLMMFLRLPFIANLKAASGSAMEEAENTAAKWWLTIFSLAAVFGAIGAFIKMYIQIKGFKPKAYYRSDFTPRTKEW